jgi:hypothetical protein
VVALQAFLLLELVVRVQTDLAATTEGYPGYWVMWATVFAAAILGATIAWMLGRVWPLVVIDVGWAMVSLIREWPLFDDLAFEGYEPLVPTAIIAAVVAISAVSLALSTRSRARALVLTGFLAFVGLLEYVLGGSLVPLGIGLLLFGIAGLRSSRTAAHAPSGHVPSG